VSGGRRQRLRRIGVFAGPSLYRDDRIVAEGLTYLPPASRGDVERASEEFDAVLLVDGVFHHDLAPSPKECYAATRRARMFGAASMGALRAAECAPYGFLPLGAIARWYVAGTIDGDDEVAVLTHPTTYEPLSVPLVNVRYAAWLAYRRGVLAKLERDTFVNRARTIFYMDRTWENVLELAPVRVRAELESIARNEGDLKRADARFALRRVLRDLIPSAVSSANEDEGRGSASREMRDTSPMKLPPSVPKAPSTYDRAVPFEETLALLPTLRKRYGITRVADTTYLDRTGIPTFSAMVPHSPDLLGVYNGKGITREGAMASAVMEATERQTGAGIRLRTFKESLRIVNGRIDLDACGVRDDVRDRVVDCVLGTELLSGDAVPVPLAMVQCPWFGERLFGVTSTNGLASGNNLTEAIYHALCELIERHAWTIYHVRCSFMPRFYLGSAASDEPLAPEIEMPAAEENVDRLVREMCSAGLHVRTLLLDEPPLPVTVLAAITEVGAPLPMAHMGLGCSLSPSHAITRALTEAVQSRVVDIQAAREDILRPDDPAGVVADHARRIKEVPKNRWYYDLQATRVPFASLPDRSSDDLATDLRTVLDALRSYGISNVIAVDISPRDLPIGVVRTIVPQLDTFVLSGHMGPMVRALLNPFAIA
jgi:ribosomal protein S12 methylthiotransferase accessory factor